MGPENTLHTFKRAVNEFKVDVLELDLQLSSDGHVVIIHNPYVHLGCLYYEYLWPYMPKY